VPRVMLLALGGGVHELDRRGDRRVEGQTRDVASTLAMVRWNCSRRPRWPVPASLRAPVCSSTAMAPGPLQEAEAADGVLGVPGLGGVQRAHVHLVEPEGVRSELR